MGWPLFLLGICGALYAAWRHSKADVMLLAYALANYLVIAGTTSEHLYYVRYALPIIVILCLFAGQVSAQIVEAAWPKRRVPLLILLALCVAPPIGASLVKAYALTQQDSRTAAKKWIEANIPAGSGVLLEGGKIEPAGSTVQLHDTPEHMRERIAYWKVIEPKQARFLELQIAVHQGVGYELELVRLDAIDPLDDYVARGIRYFVIRPTFFLGSRKAGSGSAQLVEDLRASPQVRLRRRFDGETPTQVGPTIEVYEWVQP